MSAPTRLMTVEEYRQIPEPRDGWYELHHGELVKMTWPKHKRRLIQDRLVELLQPHAAAGYVKVEIAFRPEPEHEIRVADVVYISRKRWEGIDLDDNLRGAPEIVIEVLSPSTTVAEMNEKEALCLANGCLEFWVVDPQRKFVKVSRPDGTTKRYDEGSEIPLSVFGSGGLQVSEIFGI